MSRKLRLALALGMASCTFTAGATPTWAAEGDDEIELRAAIDTPLIGHALRSAVAYRQSGACKWSAAYLRRATEDLEFYKRLHRKNPNGDISENDLNLAQRALDREKRKRCEPNAREQERANDAASLPALTGAVEPMPSRLAAGASPQARFEEADAALRKIFQNKDKCDIETARRWIEVYREMLRELRLKRDAALAAGEFSTVDPQEAHRAVITMRSILEVAEDQFERYRIECAKKKGQCSAPVPDTTDQTAGLYDDDYFFDNVVETGAGGLNGSSRFADVRSSSLLLDVESIYDGAEDVEDLGITRVPFDTLPGEQPVDPAEAAELQELADQYADWIERLKNGLTGDEQSMLDVHNKARHEFGVAPLEWDVRLAADAQAYAEQLETIGTLKHSPREGREEQRENLLATQKGYRSPGEMIQVMVDERMLFMPGIYPDISVTGDWYPVGHYTQIVWPWTTHVGCGVHSGELFDWTVCRYSPPGNRDGDPLFAFNGLMVEIDDCLKENAE